MRVEHIGSATLILADCMDVMRNMPDKAFELAIVDPPYGIGGSRATGGYAREAINYSKENDKLWDLAPPDQGYFDELFRVTKNQIIWGGNYMVKILPPSKGWICWYKTDEVKGRDFSEFELAFSSFNVPGRHFACRPFIPSNERIHPTQKPVALYKWLLKNYAKPGDKILDTHGGSGSSVIACLDMGFEITWIEKDPDYFEAALKRIKDFAAQPKLPIEEKSEPIEQEFKL
jgi:site-specific DNA-methyltransferase (adenine-specific)